MKLLKLINNLLFPRRCPVCDRVVKLGTMICEPCKKRLVKITGPRCYKCGKSLKSEYDEFCYDCQRISHVFDQGISLYEYNSVCKSIYRFKYSGRAEYSDYFSKEMAKLLKNKIKEWKPDGIIPVPLHRNKYNIRGYNQAALLADKISQHLRIPYYPSLINRKINTIPLKELNPDARQINLKNAFIIGTDDVKLSRVVIVDDIYTTGSTIDEISRLLKGHGVEKVYFITLSVGAGL